MGLTNGKKTVNSELNFTCRNETYRVLDTRSKLFLEVCQSVCIIRLKSNFIFACTEMISHGQYHASEELEKGGFS